jgi:hypothetical protein
MSREKSGLEIAPEPVEVRPTRHQIQGGTMDRNENLEPREGRVLHHDSDPGVGDEVGEAHIKTFSWRSNGLTRLPIKRTV